MGRHIVVMKLFCSLGHFVRDGHTLHRLSQWHLTANWLAPRESDCSRMGSRVSSDWLPSYFKITWPALKIFKMDGYFPDSPRMCILQGTAVIYARCTSVWLLVELILVTFIGHYFSNPFMALSFLVCVEAISQGKTMHYFVVGGRKLFSL